MLPCMEPLVRVTRGAPTDEELAAVVSVLLARALAAPPAPPAPPSRWRESGLPALAGLRPGPGAWRASALPTIR